MGVIKSYSFVIQNFLNRNYTITKRELQLITQLNREYVCVCVGVCVCVCVGGGVEGDGLKPHHKQ